MPRPPALQRAWDADPDIGKRGGRPKKHFPENGTPEQQAKWFRREYLKLADKEKDPAKKAILLAKAQSTIPKPRAGKSKDSTSEFTEHLSRLAEAQERKLEAAKGGGNGTSED